MVTLSPFSLTLWLKGQARIDYKLSTTCHNFSDSSPVYLSNPLPSRQVHCSADTQTLCVTHNKTETFGQALLLLLLFFKLCSKALEFSPFFFNCAQKHWNSLFFFLKLCSEALEFLFSFFKLCSEALEFSFLFFFKTAQKHWKSLLFLKLCSEALEISSFLKTVLRSIGNLFFFLNCAQKHWKSLLLFKTVLKSTGILSLKKKKLCSEAMEFSPF